MKYSKLIVFIFVGLFIIEAFGVLGNSGLLNIANATYISAFIKYISIIIIISIAFKVKSKNDIPKTIRTWVFIWLTWNLFEIIRAVFLAANYWDWKFLFLQSIPFSLVVLVFYIGKNPHYVKLILKFSLRYALPLGFFIIPFALGTQKQLYARLMIFVSVLMLFIPYLKNKWKILIIIVAIASIVVTPLFRTNLIKITFSVLILGVFYFSRIIGDKTIKKIHLLIFLLPVLLLILGALGKFNFFKDISQNQDYAFYSGTVGVGQSREKSVNADTRTFLFVEVLATMEKKNSWIIGQSAVGKYHTNFFNYMPIPGERSGTEVGILNILLYDGLIGVFIYSLLLFIVSRTAICQSNNRLTKMLGLLIASRWMTSFIAEFTKFDLNFFFFWLMIGLVSTSYFRNLSDNDIKEFFYDL